MVKRYRCIKQMIVLLIVMLSFNVQSCRGWDYEETKLSNSIREGTWQYNYRKTIITIN